MPFLRVLRDKRGYETTYLMHWFRDGSRQHSRVLYLFRTPGGARVGRTPLEPEVLRQIEAQYPEIAFDWSAVRENQQVIEPPPEYRRRKPKREEAEAEEEAVTATAPPATPEPMAAPADVPPHVIVSAPAPAQQPQQATRPPIPSVIGGVTSEERVAFLTEWHPLICERIVLRTADPLRREALGALAEQLNPAAWTDDAQVATGLLTAAEALERLSRVLARRRRGSRRRSGDRKPGGTDAAAQEPGTAASASDAGCADSEAGPDAGPDDADDTGFETGSGSDQPGAIDSDKP